MGNFCELLINVVRREVLKLLAGIFVAGHSASCTECVTRQATGEQTDPASVV